MLRTVMLVVAGALLLAAGPANDAERDQKSADAARAAALVKDLADRMKAGGAANKLFDLGIDAVPALANLVRASSDLYARGWAVKTLGWIMVPGGAASEAATAVLESVRGDADVPVLVRTWADAALIHDAYPLDDLLGMADRLETDVALERPFSSRAQLLTHQKVLEPELEPAERAERQREWARRLLQAGQRQAQLQRALFPALSLLPPAVLVDIVREGEPTSLRRLAAEHLVSMGPRRADASMTAALDALRSTPFADAPALASVDDPRAARERPRTSYLHVDNGIASVAILPELRHGDERVALLLALPSSPGGFLFPPSAFDGLAAMAKLDGSLQERATLLPVSYAHSESYVIGDMEDLRRWAEDSSLRLEERVLTAAKRYLAADWTLMGVNAGSPAYPLGFRFYASAPVLPRDLLADDDAWQRLFLVTSSPMALAGKERPIRARVAPAELRAAMARQGTKLRDARELLLANQEAARERALSTVGGFRDDDMVVLSLNFGLTAGDTARLLRASERKEDEAEDVSLWLTVLEGDLSDGILTDEAAPTTLPAPEPAAEASAAATPDDESSSPLVRRFEGNRIFGLLRKIWDDEDEHEDEPVSVEQPPSAAPEPVDEQPSEEQPDGAAE